MQPLPEPPIHKKRPPATAAVTAVAPTAGRLRICLVSETMITGVGRHVTDLAKAMTGRGHEVHLLHSNGRIEQPLLDELSGLPRLTRRVLPMRREPHWSDPAILLALLYHLWRFGPFDVIHGHSSKGGVYARVLGLIAANRACIYTPHAFATLQPELSPARRRFYAAIERGLGMVTDSVICCSDEERQHAASELRIAASRLRMIPNGISAYDTSLAGDLRARLGLAAGAVVIGFVGRMDEQKAPQRLVEASPEVVAAHPAVHIVMIGVGPLRAELEARTRRLGIADRFTWCGHVPAREWIPGFDILAMPSVYEACSYVLLEALYAGVPVVCTPVSGVRDALVDGVHGFVVPHGDRAALAGRLSCLAGDPGLRAQMSRHAREQGASFSIPRMMDRLEAAYLSPRGRGAAAGAELSGA